MVGLNSSRGLNAVEAAAAIGFQHLGWTHNRVKQEIAEYREQVGQKLKSGGKPRS